MTTVSVGTELKLVILSDQDNFMDIYDIKLGYSFKNENVYNTIRREPSFT